MRKVQTSPKREPICTTCHRLPLMTAAASTLKKAIDACKSAMRLPMSASVSASPRQSRMRLITRDGKPPAGNARLPQAGSKTTL